MITSELRKPERDEMICANKGCKQPMVRVGYIALNPLEYVHKTSYFTHPFKHGSSHHGLYCGWSRRHSDENHHLPYFDDNGKYRNDYGSKWDVKWYQFCFWMCAYSKDPETGKRETGLLVSNFKWGYCIRSMGTFLKEKIQLHHCPKTRIGKVFNLIVCMALGFKLKNWSQLFSLKFHSDYKRVNEGYKGMVISQDGIQVEYDVWDYSD